MWSFVLCIIVPVKRFIASLRQSYHYHLKAFRVDVVAFYLFIYLLLRSGFSFKERKKKEGLFELYQIGLVYVLFKL